MHFETANLALAGAALTAAARGGLSIGRKRDGVQRGLTPACTPGASRAALPTPRLGGNAGYGWTPTNVETWRSRSLRAGLGAALSLPAGFTLGVNAAFQDGRGSRPHFTIGRKRRREETVTLSPSAHNRALTVPGFAPRPSLVREERRTSTNTGTLDYARNRAERSFVRQF